MAIPINERSRNVKTGTEAKSDTWNPRWMIVIGIMVIVIGAGIPENAI